MHGKFWSALLALTLLGQDEVLFRAQSNFIAVDVQVLAGEQSVIGLKREDFRVWDNGKPQAISNFGADDQELDIILMLDTSQSTTVIQESIKRSATQAMSHLFVRDRLGVVVFADEPLVLVAPTLDRVAVEAGLEKLPAGRGGTELSDNILKTAKYLRQKARPNARRAIVMMTDNKGYESVSDEDVRNALWETNVVFNALLFRAPGSGSADVRKFVKLTGGEVLRFRPEGVPLAELFQRLRQRYYLLYPAPPSQPGQVHQIKVELSDEAKRRFRTAKVSARSGYVGGAP